MKDGERLVWAAAFAQGMAGINYDDQEAAGRQTGVAALNAYAAVMAMRSLADGFDRHPTRDKPAWVMLRDMAGLTH